MYRARWKSMLLVIAMTWLNLSFWKKAKFIDEPDWEIFATMCRECTGKGIVIMEGKIWTPDDALKALYYGAHAVVVGSAITRPHITARRFVDHMQGFPEKRSLLY